MKRSAVYTRARSSVLYVIPIAHQKDLFLNESAGQAVHKIRPIGEDIADKVPI